MAAPVRCTRSQVAREIGIRTVIIPTAPGVFSAFGMLFSDLRYDFVRTWFTRLEDAPFDEIERVYRELEDQGRAAIAGTSVEPRKIVLKRAADMRYVGQEHAVTVDLPLAVFEKQDRAAIKRHFDAMHELRYGTSAPDERAEIVSLRTTVTGVMRKPPQEKIGRGKRAPAKAAFTGKRPVYVGRQVPADADLCARRARCRQPHQRPGADRGARLDHGAAAGRPARGRCLRQSGDQGGEGWPLDRPWRRRQRKPARSGARSIPSSRRSCATASSR